MSKLLWRSNSSQSWCVCEDGGSFMYISDSQLWEYIDKGFVEISAQLALALGFPV